MAKKNEEVWGLTWEQWAKAGGVGVGVGLLLALLIGLMICNRGASAPAKFRFY